MYIWFGWLAKYDSVYHLGTTTAQVANAFNTAKSQLAANPAGGVVGPDEWTDVFLEAGYYEQTWLQLGSLFSEWVNDPGPTATSDLVAAYQSTDTPGDDNEFAGYLAVECSEGAWPSSWPQIIHDNWATYLRAPFETWDNAWFNGPCTNWPAPHSDPVQINGDGISSALLIDETLDAATPFSGSLEVRKLFPNAVLLAEPGGTSHADSLFGDTCVDGTIAAYLSTGALPRSAAVPAVGQDLRPVAPARPDGPHGRGEGGDPGRVVAGAAAIQPCGGRPPRSRRRSIAMTRRASRRATSPTAGRPSTRHVPCDRAEA